MKIGVVVQLRERRRAGARLSPGPPTVGPAGPGTALARGPAGEQA